MRAKLYETFEHYLNKMVARVIMSVESFTRPPVEFQCEWADSLVQACHIQELWGPQQTCEDDFRQAERSWLALGVGITVIDGVIDEELAALARGELAALEAAGDVQASR